MLVYTFYKIAIKGTKHCYVGSTLNLSRRLSSHKDSVTNYLCPNHHLKLYETIRAHGGWSSVTYTIVGACEVLNRADAMIEEQKLIVQHKADLNMVAAGTYSLPMLVEMKNMTPLTTDVNKKKRQKLSTAIWKKAHGRNKYNTWQRNYMRGKMAYDKQARLLRYCLL